MTVPDTCVPTLTSTTGLSVPLADTVCVTSPFLDCTVRYFFSAPALDCFCQAYQPPAPAAMISSSSVQRLKRNLETVMSGISRVERGGVGGRQ